MNYNKYIVIHRQMRRSNYETFIIKVRVYTSYIFPINFITINAQLLYAFWDIRNSVPGDFQQH